MAVVFLAFNKVHFGNSSILLSWLISPESLYSYNFFIGSETYLGYSVDLCTCTGSVKVREGIIIKALLITVTMGWIDSVCEPLLLISSREWREDSKTRVV